MEHCGAADAEGHDDQADAEEGVQLADDLVDGEHGCQEVVDQNDDGPESDAEGAWRQQGQKAGRPYHEDDADTQQQNDGKDAHQGFHERSQINSDDFGNAGAVVALRKHAAQIIVDCPGEDGAKYDPKIYDRTPNRSGKGAEDRPQSCDIEELDQESSPWLHGYVIYAVRMGCAGCQPLVRPKDAFDDFSIGEKTDYQ